MSDDKFMNKDKLTEFIGFCFKWRDGDLLTFEKGSDKMNNKKNLRLSKKKFGGKPLNSW